MIGIDPAGADCIIRKGILLGNNALVSAMRML